MSNSANIPALGNKIVVDIPALNTLLRQMIQAELANVTDLPTRAKQLVEGSSGWEVQQFNGSAWVTLEDWNINAQKVDGFSVSQSATANAVAVRDKDGALPGNLTGNAATATKAAALSAVNPVAMGGTGATTAEDARDNLGVTDLLEAVNDRVDTTNSNLATTNSNLATTNSNLATTNSNLATTNSNLATTNNILTALDAAVVHKSGAETIAGAKTFSTTPIVKGNSPALYLNEDTFEKGVLPTTNQHWGIVFNDKNNSMHGRVQHYVNSNGQTATTLTTTSVDGSVSGTLGVVVRANGTVEGYCPSTPANSTDNQIVTADFLQKDQTMAGVKTFTGKVAQEGAKTIHSYKNTDVTKGTAPASNKYWDVEFTDKNGNGDTVNRIGTLTVSLTPNNLASTVLRAYKPEAGSSASAILAVQYPASGTPYATAPTPDATSNTTHIATTAWVRGKGVLVESWHSGANWYRKYSDGWIEQGGVIDWSVNGNKGNLVTLHTPFVNKNYVPQLTLNRETDTDQHWGSVGALTTTSFKVFVRWMSAEHKFYWTACGY